MLTGALAWSGEPVTVYGTVSMVRPGRASKPDHSGAVVWLKPAAGALPRAEDSTPRQRFQMLQQHKRFDPHLLAVPVGAIVEFPNLDPFFHNVFSMADGKRFDLGLYEAGKSHAVKFDRPGISYIFCNIHPEMSAVVIVLESPYYAVSDRAGEFFILNVPPGRYLVSVWHERGKPEAPEEFPREVTISLANPSLGAIRLVDSGQLSVPHKNKYGRDYDTPAPPGVIYK